jgi:RNA polymerase nonessential primary-like sigma factor
LIGECQVALIRVVAAYNPWRNVRFSTYAYTCLMRAVGRVWRRHAHERVVQHLPREVDAITDAPQPERPTTLDSWEPWRPFLRAGHPLLSDWEKTILERRFQLSGEAKQPTLERVGRELGLSKERVRQLQVKAVDKLRRALANGAEMST